MADIRLLGRATRNASSLVRGLRTSQVWDLRRTAPQLRGRRDRGLYSGADLRGRQHDMADPVGPGLPGPGRVRRGRHRGNSRGTGAARDAGARSSVRLVPRDRHYPASVLCSRGANPLAIHKLWRTRRMLIYRRVFSHAAHRPGLRAGVLRVPFDAATVAGPEPGSGLHALSWVAAVAACGLIGCDRQLRRRDGGDPALGSGCPDQGPRRHARLADHRPARTEPCRLADPRGRPQPGAHGAGAAHRRAVPPLPHAVAAGGAGPYRRQDRRPQRRHLAARGHAPSSTGRCAAASPLALVMVDIDHFSSVNETAGLDAGDQVLRGIARTLTENLQGCRPGRAVRREQFAILLPQTGETAGPADRGTSA